MSEASPSPEEASPRNSEGFHDLILRAQAGDKPDMDRLLTILRPYLEHLARPFADPDQPAKSTSDLLQDSFLRAWQRIGTFDGGNSDEETYAMFRGWLGQIVRRLGLDAQRARERQRRKPPGEVLRIGHPRPGQSTSLGGVVDPPAREASPSAYARSEELDRSVREAIAKLPDALNADIVRLYMLEGLNLAQIAERLGLGYDKVRDRYWATMRHLQRDLKEWL